MPHLLSAQDALLKAATQPNHDNVMVLERVQVKLGVLDTLDREVIQGRKHRISAAVWAARAK